MVKKLPLHRAVIAYLKSEKGEEPLQFSAKDKHCILIFGMFKNKLANDASIDVGSEYLEVELPVMMIRAGKTYIDNHAIQLINNVIMANLYDAMIAEILHFAAFGYKYKHAMEIVRSKYHITENELSTDTLWKRVQRYRQQMGDKKKIGV